MPFTRTNSPTIANRFSKRDTKKASLINANGKEYLVEVGVGTPPQYFNLTLDTGSSDFWVPSTACPVTMCPHTRFENHTSSTFKQLPEPLIVDYGMGSARGVYATDAVTIGPATMNDQTIGLVSTTVNILSETDEHSSNGIIGLGFPDLSTKLGTKPGHFVTGLYQSNIIPEPVFSVFLNSQFAYGKSGEVILGGTDTTKYNEKELQYLPVITYDISAYDITPNLGANSTKNGSYYYWSVPGQGVSTSTGFKSPSNVLLDFILDTGTTLTYVPTAIAKSIVMSVTSTTRAPVLDTINGAYRVNCELAKKSKATVQFMMSPSASTVSTTPITITVPLSELIIPADDALTPEASLSCIFGIAPLPESYQLTTGETWILGEATFRSIYSVYDLKENRIGLAKLSATSDVTNANTTETTKGTSSNPGAEQDNTVTSSDENNTSSSYCISPSTWAIVMLYIVTLYSF
ncbi:hypothetical protein INT47_004812 [Mucor saturninus]|uniref:rhizopuspepsin n=1 Tax=Mucor saturninus TaxID=64648 RepID=A0A8H7R208_9FUNG|nr:hypothetical protein INT47_004812 [Mucor saturninus]